MACKTSQDLPLKEMLLQVMLGCGHGTFLLHRVTWQMLTDGDRINQHSDVNQADGRFGQCVLYFRRYTGNVTRNLTSIPLECTNASHIQRNMDWTMERSLLEEGIGSAMDHHTNLMLEA